MAMTNSAKEAESEVFGKETSVSDVLRCEQRNTASETTTGCRFPLPPGERRAVAGRPEDFAAVADQFSADTRQSSWKAAFSGTSLSTIANERKLSDLQI